MSPRTAAKLFSLFLFLTGPAYGQSQPAPAPQPQLSPQAAYEQVMRPLDITRRSISNWSESELNALSIAVVQATGECHARTPEQFSGDNLISYARLCSLGQQWSAVGEAATRYITSTDTAKPQLTQAYAYQINAALHGNDPKVILADSQAMLKAVPYNSLTDETLYGALHYLQLAYMTDALNLYIVRQPILLAAIRAPQPSTPAPDAVPVHTLYADALDFAALQQFAGVPEAAAQTRAELDAALPATLPPDEAIPIAETRRQYAMLGTPLPNIPLAVSLFAQGETPRINTNYGSSTVLFLFPDWCAQCVRMAQQLAPTLFRISERGVHLYGLLAQPIQPVAAPPKPTTKARPAPTQPKQPPAPEPPKTVAELLRGSPTLITPPETIHQFAATDFPLVIATDPKGIIRFMQTAPDTTLVPGGFLDQITTHIAQVWPRSEAAIQADPSTPSQP